MSQIPFNPNNITQVTKYFKKKDGNNPLKVFKFEPGSRTLRTTAG